MSTLCPCGSKRAYQSCCEPLHQGQLAPTPEALMRSRYSAFVLKLNPYLLSSWDERTRPATLELDDNTQWYGLSVQRSHQYGDRGEVSFVAFLRDAGEWLQLQECSQFNRAADGHWRYVDGQAQWLRWNIGRNDDCPCGRGKKFKKCCANES